jgi:hypothetical protein
MEEHANVCMLPLFEMIRRKKNNARIMKLHKSARTVVAVIGIVGGIGFLLNINGIPNKIFLILAILGFFAFAILDYVERKKN